MYLLPTYCPVQNTELQISALKAETTPQTTAKQLPLFRH